MATSSVSSARPDQILKRFSDPRASPSTWPSWILVRWEDSFLFRRWVQQMWDLIKKADDSADRVTLYPRDASSVETFFQEIGSASLFCSARLIVAHAARPLAKTIPMEKLAAQMATIPDRTVLILAAEGMGKVETEAAILSKATAKSPRQGIETAVWKPFSGDQLLSVARDLLNSRVVRADSETLKFWLDRIGANLERLYSEATRFKLQFPDGEATQERLEELFETPHVHDETVWDALRAMLSGDPAKATTALKALIQSADVYLASAELSRALLCVDALSRARSAGIPPTEIFFKYDLKGKRRQDKLLELTALTAGPNWPLPDMAERLLALDLAIKQSKTAAGRQEVLLRSLSALCGEPQTAA